MRKTKGYSKGGVKLQKARGGKMMTKGMRRGGVKTAMGGKMMTKGMRRGGVRMANKGKMMTKGYAKGGTKMIKANVGRIATMSLAQAKKVLKANNMKAVKIKKT